MDDFGNLLYAEIDYIAEAANARRFSELYAQDVAIADVFVPKVYSELTTRKVLTMEWVDGFRLTDSDSLEANNLDRKKLVDTLVQCSLRQIMEMGFYHADPHAGSKYTLVVNTMLIYCSLNFIPHTCYIIVSFYRSSRDKGWETMLPRLWNDVICSSQTT
jgi:predicted unusual protein kinase regulating ubiquinone biosynthesis (AarF/ABC1/UbiB family)